MKRKRTNINLIVLISVLCTSHSTVCWYIHAYVPSWATVKSMRNRKVNDVETVTPWKHFFFYPSHDPTRSSHRPYIRRSLAKLSFQKKTATKRVVTFDTILPVPPPCLAYFSGESLWSKAGNFNSSTPLMQERKILLKVNSRRKWNQVIKSFRKICQQLWQRNNSRSLRLHQLQNSGEQIGCKPILPSNKQSLSL